MARCTTGKQIAEAIRDRYCPGCSLAVVNEVELGVIRRADKIHEETGKLLPDCFLEAVLLEAIDAIVEGFSK